VAKAKQIAKIDCQEPAPRVIEQALQARMKKMSALSDRALDWNDPEGVHDMRVASRRLRSALGDFKPYLRKGSIPAGRLRAIAKSLGAVRDEDVILLALAELESKAGEKVGQGIKAIAEEHDRQRQQARAILEHTIRPSAIAELRDDFRAALRTAAKTPSDPPEEKGAGRVLTFFQVGTKVIGDRLEQLSEAGGAVYRPLQTKQLHKLRILAKKLRYAIELFAPCWGDEFKKAAEEIAHFQTSLGELHDCDVWIVNLGARLRKDALAAGAGLESWQNNESIVWLLHHFVRERTRHYCDSLSRWHKWQTEGFLDRLRTMLDADFTLAPPTSLNQPGSKGGSAPLLSPEPPFSTGKKSA